MFAIPNLTVDTFGLAPPKFKRGFFIDHRKGEVGELRFLLRKMALDNHCEFTGDRIMSSITKTHIKLFSNSNLARRRDILKRLIRCMTLGIDLSRLYTDVVMVSQTDDTVQKRMIYLYLSTFSASNPDLAILAINTLLKDAESVDPVIRCLAIRNITSLGTPMSIEYATSVVSKKLYDATESVKRTAIICTIRNHRNRLALCSSATKTDLQKTPVVQDLKLSLNSSNVHVMFDSMCAMSEILGVDKIELTTSSMIYLANCLHSMNEWEQCILLESLSTFVPSSKEELFDLMNLLDSKLSHTSSSIVLSTAKCFIMWTKDDPSFQLEVIKRLQTPFISLIISSRHEISYVMLINTLLIIVNVSKLISESLDETISTSPIPFKEHYDVFFCNYDDPSYIKHVKLDILVAISCDDNCLHIIRELNEYVSDTNHDIATKSVKALGIIALRSPAHLEMITKQLCFIFDLRVPYLTSSVLFIIKGLLRAYPDYKSNFLDIIKDKNDFIIDSESKAYYIWILGEFGYDLDHAPYTLEDYINEDNTDLVKEELLLASMKVFLKRPPEMYAQLSKLFKMIINESNNPTLVNLATFYYNLIKSDINLAEKIFFDEHRQYNTRVLMGQTDLFVPDILWREHFNTIHLIETCRTGFKPFFPYVHGPVTNDIFKPLDSEDESEENREEHELKYPDDSIITALLPSYDDDLKFVEYLQDELKDFKLIHPNTLLSENFQKEWFELEKVYTNQAVTSCAILEELNVERLENILSRIHIITLASGKTRESTKLYLYTENENGCVYYIEIIVEPAGESSGLVRVSIKVNDTSNAETDTTIQSFSKILCDFINDWFSKTNLF